MTLRLATTHAVPAAIDDTRARQARHALAAHDPERALSLYARLECVCPPPVRDKVSFWLPKFAASAIFITHPQPFFLVLTTLSIAVCWHLARDRTRQADWDRALAALIDPMESAAECALLPGALGPIITLHDTLRTRLGLSSPTLRKSALRLLCRPHAASVLDNAQRATLGSWIGGQTSGGVWRWLAPERIAQPVDPDLAIAALMALSEAGDEDVRARASLLAHGADSERMRIAAREALSMHTSSRQVGFADA